MKCPNCGRDVPDHVHFCPGCGYPLQEKAIEQENKSNEGRYAVQQHSGNNRHLMPILISVLVAVVLIVLIICVTMLKKGDQNLAAQTAQQTQSSSMRSSAESSAVSSAVSSAAPTSSSQAPSSAVSSKPQVVNNYYYYASGAGLGKGNVQDYYNNVSDSGYLWPPGAGAPNGQSEKFRLGISQKYYTPLYKYVNGENKRGNSDEWIFWISGVLSICGVYYRYDKTANHGILGQEKDARISLPISRCSARVCNHCGQHFWQCISRRKDTGIFIIFGSGIVTR